MKYQAVVRDGTGNPILNQSVNFKISILMDSEFGTLVYSETHLVTTSNFGLVNLIIGMGQNKTGVFSPGGWGDNTFFIKTEVDVNGGDSFMHLGTSQILSVPYAFHAQTVSEDEVNDADTDPGNELQSISLEGNELTLSKGGGIVELPDNQGGTLELPYSGTGSNSGDLFSVINTSGGSGLYGRNGMNNNFGRIGTASDGIYGQSHSIGGSGISGVHSGEGNGVYGRSEGGYAGKFAGNVFMEGNLGIGITDPAHRLQVNGTIHSTLNGCKFPDGTIQTTAAISSGNDNLGTHIANQNIQLNDNWLSGDGDDEGVFVSFNGMVGVYTTNPEDNLHVEGRTRTNELFVATSTKFGSTGADILCIREFTGFTGALTNTSFYVYPYGWSKNNTRVLCMEMANNADEDMWVGLGTFYYTLEEVGIRIYHSDYPSRSFRMILMRVGD